MSVLPEDYSENFDLEKLPENLTSDYLLEYKSRLERSLTIVSRKVSELILSHQPAYVDELQRIADLQKSITDSIRVCTQGRSCLKVIKDGNAKNGSTIVEHYKKRESLAKLLDSLTAISNLRNSVFEIRKLIDSQEDFPKAIQMCKNGKLLLSSFQEYKCVNELGFKLNDTIELIGEQVDTVLSKMCLSFSPSTYAKLQTSYILMDRSEIAVDQLLMHFCSAINSEANVIVAQHIIHVDNINTSQEDNTITKNQESSPTATRQKKDFQDLCRMVSPEKFLECLVRLCTTFWRIMLNYKRILSWHNVETPEEATMEQTTEENIQSSPLSENEPSEKSSDKGEFKRLYIKQKLIGGLGRLWYDMKRKLSLLILNHDFSTYRFDEFIKILNIVDLKMRIGDEFCGGPSSNDLRDCINKQALNFFNAYHKSSLDELKMFLENELWDIVPVKNDFKLVQLKEFSFLRTSSTEQAMKLAAYQISNYTENLLFFTPELINCTDDMKEDTSSTNVTLPNYSEPVIPFEKILQVNKETVEDLFGQEQIVPYLDSGDPLPLDKISLSSGSDDDLESELNEDFVEEEELTSFEDEHDDMLTLKNNSLRDTTNLSTKVQSSSTGSGTATTKSRYLLTRHSGPVLTNSSLNVLRLFGKYIQMMTVLEPISYEILMRIYNLLDHYTMVVYRRFAPDSDKKSDDKNVSLKLMIAIRSIRESLIGGQTMEESTTINKTNETNLSVQQGVPNIANIITRDLTSGASKEEELINPKKAVAIESLIFLANQLWNLQEYLESLIPSDSRPQLRKQFSQNNSIVPEFLKAFDEIHRKKDHIASL